MVLHPPINDGKMQKKYITDVHPGQNTQTNTNEVRASQANDVHPEHEFSDESTKRETPS